jgi:predicted metal-dependent phosphoesterase TrpH
LTLLSLWADFHTHAIGEEAFGPRAETLVARHVEAAVAAGLDCLAVTDHNDLRPGLMAQEYAARHSHQLLILPGMELTTHERVHVVAVGLTEPIPAWRPLDETIARIREAGGLSVLPHPFFRHLRTRRDVDAIEQFNARYGDFDLNGTDVARVADSDAHTPGDLRASPHRTRLEATSRSWPAILEAIRAGRTTPT